VISKTTIVYYPDTSKHRIVPQQTGLEPTPILLPRLGATVLPAIRSDMELATNPPRDFPYGYVELHTGEKKCLTKVPWRNTADGQTFEEAFQAIHKGIASDEERAEHALLMEHAQIARKVKEGAPSPGERVEIERIQKDTCKVWGNPGHLYRQQWHVEGQNARARELAETATPVGWNAENRTHPTLERCQEVEALIRSGRTRPCWMPGREPPVIAESALRGEMCIWLFANGWTLEGYEEAKSEQILTSDKRDATKQNSKTIGRDT